MDKRNANARGIQNGACNPHAISRVLVEALDECRALYLNPADDPAVFLILHQLVFLLMERDVAVSDTYLGDRWAIDTKTLDAELKED